MSVNYQVHNLPLTEARVDEQIPVNGGYVVFTRVDGPVYVRLGAGQPKIRVAQPSDFLACQKLVVDALFITNEVGNGEVEFIVSNDVRVGFSAPVAASSEPRIRLECYPSKNAAALQGANTQTGSDGISYQSTTGAAHTAKTDDLGVAPDRIFGWEMECTEVLTNLQGAYSKLLVATGRAASLPLQTLLSPDPVGKNLAGIGIFETETDVYWEQPAGGDQVLRFGIGHCDFANVDANSCDCIVGFAGGHAFSRPASFGGLGISGTVPNTELVCAIIGDTAPGGVAGAGRTVFYANNLGSGYGGVMRRLKVRVGEIGGIPIVEWYVDGALVDRYEGALPTEFLTPKSGGPVGTRDMAPLMMGGRHDKGSTYIIRWGWGSGWTQSHYVS